MDFIESIFRKVRRHPKRIVFPEGEDDRIIQAAHAFHHQKLGTAILIGKRKIIEKKAAKLKIALDHIGVIDLAHADDLPHFADALSHLRKSKGVTKAEAMGMLKYPAYFATMMLHEGNADGMVAGTSISASAIFRPLFQILTLEPGVRTASSCSVLRLPDKSFGFDGALYMADCSVIPEPSAEQLADIAIMSAKLARQFHGRRPHVAFLSYSTKGSAHHRSIEKIMTAVAMARQIADRKDLEADFDGELQADAALIPLVAQSKNAHSSVAGHANVLIFPDLNTGNICSKLIQALARGVVYGPFVNGLSKPACELSRNCTVEEILGSAAMVALQSVEYRNLYSLPVPSTGKKKLQRA